MEVFSLLLYESTRWQRRTRYIICLYVHMQMDVLDIWPTGVTDCFSGFQWDGWSMESAKNC